LEIGEALLALADEGLDEGGGLGRLSRRCYGCGLRVRGGMHERIEDMDFPGVKIFWAQFRGGLVVGIFIPRRTR